MALIRSRYRLAGLALLALCIAPCAATGAAETKPAQQVAQRACNAIAEHAGAAAGPPEFLASYPALAGHDEPALKTVAFTYDNALAVIALIACDKRPQAIRIGEALRMAADTAPRLRNAYRAGPIDGKPLPNGWWDDKARQWAEDPHQMGTATGNVAWTGLALLALYEATGEPRWRTSAAQLARWIMNNTASGAPGFTGGLDGFDTDPRKLEWKSTEHNIDAAALFEWLARDSAPGDWHREVQRAMRFVDAQWDSSSGHFFIGTLPDGRENTADSALDVQMWALLLPHGRKDWQRAIAYTETHYGVRGGFDFNTDRDGLWLEGTAQAALVYRLHGMPAKADALFRTIDTQFSTGGYLYATREPRISTGLALGPDSASADFYYYRLPHLGATAWAALAALGWNPFIAQRR